MFSVASRLLVDGLLVGHRDRGDGCNYWSNGPAAGCWAARGSRVAALLVLQEATAAALLLRSRAAGRSRTTCSHWGGHGCGGNYWGRHSHWGNYDTCATSIRTTVTAVVPATKKAT